MVHRLFCSWSYILAKSLRPLSCGDEVAVMAAPAPYHIFSDFDGTISRQDSLQLLLNQFGGPQWNIIDAKMSSGEMSEREALVEAFKGFPLPVADAAQWVFENVSLDPSFVTFNQWAKERSFPLTVLSGGFLQFIRPLLAREGIFNLSVIANSVKDVSGGWQVSSAVVSGGCDQFHHCKCSSVDARAPMSGGSLVYIGDGLTDFCPVSKADIIFAKKSLADFCERKSIPFFRFNDFRDVRVQLEEILSRRAA